MLNLRPTRPAVVCRKAYGRAIVPGRLPALREPVEHAHRAESVPATRRALAILHLEVRRALADVLEGPPAIRTPVALNDPDCLGDALVWPLAGIAQVVERPEDVVVVPVRERELEVAGVDYLARRLPTEQPALEHVLLAPASGRSHVG